MITFILGPQEHHGVKTLEEYEKAQQRALEVMRSRGMRYVVHESPAPKYARVNHNSWIIDCECGAGNAVFPQWDKAYCFGCGAIHPKIIFPVNWSLIEALLLERPVTTHRNWLPDEPLENLEEENLQAGHKVFRVLEGEKVE